MVARPQATSQGNRVLVLSGRFEAADAWSVHEELKAADRLWPVVLDFSRVQSYEDFAVALLAPDLVAPGGLRIRVRGLGLHPRRILEYFGVKGVALDERARSDLDRAGPDDPLALPH